MIEQKSMELGVDPCLVASIVWCESMGDTYSSRYEPAYRYTFRVAEFAKDLGITKETEEVHQKTSFGLMHIMGGVARELGFRHHLLALTDPVVGLHFGCLKLKRICQKYSDFYDVIASYNAGSPRKNSLGRYVNHDYVDRVLLRYRELIK